MKPKISTPDLGQIQINLVRDVLPRQGFLEKSKLIKILLSVCHTVLVYIEDQGL